VNIVIKFIVKIMMRKYKNMKCKQYKGIKMGLGVAWIVCNLLQTCVAVLGGGGLHAVSVALKSDIVV
jgi:hypothetical protein